MAIVAFQDGKISSERIYWDQASVLLQLGVLENRLPVLGADQANRLLQEDALANEAIERTREA